MAGMNPPLLMLRRPMPLAGLLTLATLGYSLRYAPDGNRLAAAALLLAYGVLFVLLQLVPQTLRRTHTTLLLGMPVLALLLIGLAMNVGTPQVLMVVWVACIFSVWPLRAAIIATLLANLAMYLVLRGGTFSSPLSLVLINMGFQALAGICVSYARSAERNSEALARANADLLATRALLADRARDAERLRVARELHDVAGHKLTAMRLNLRELSLRPELATHPELALAERLSAELLADIRQVVQSLRDDRGLDLATALRALAAPFPKPRLQLTIADDVRIGDPALAEVVLRLAQEGLTNAARHAGAGQAWLDINRQDGQLQFSMHDDGRSVEWIREGNGIAGMRERVAEAGGRFELARTGAGGMWLKAWLPL
jgi:signal transduction histidine kinase